MNILEEIRQNKNFRLRNNVYILDFDSQRFNFESVYLKLRNKEERFYDDKTLSLLPEISSEHIHYKEWKIRENSSQKLLKYLKKKSNNLNILELGCGNGWLANRIAELDEINVIGLDINMTELEQAARVFPNRKNLLFLCADIFDVRLNNLNFDYIILSGAIQYFGNLEVLIGRLLELLNPKGEIHIFDSPFYTEQNIQRAREKSLEHFKEMEAKEISSFFHFHKLKDLSVFNPQTRYKPDSLFNRLKRKLLYRNLSPFYWFKIVKMIEL